MAASCVNLTALLAAAGIDAAALGLASVGVILGMLLEQVVGSGMAETGSVIAEAADVDLQVKYWWPKWMQRQDWSCQWCPLPLSEQLV